MATAIAREIEMTGIPTVCITVSPEDTRQAGAPRAIFPQPFTPGHSLGEPFDKALQTKVLLDALKRWEAREEAGTIWKITYPEQKGLEDAERIS